MGGLVGRWAWLAVGSAVTAEFLLGDQYLSDAAFQPGAQVVTLAVFVAFYGSAAVVIREVTRRIGRGWPTILLLAFAFGVVEEGLLTQSLFDPGYLGRHKTAYGLVPVVGMGVPWTIFVLTLHVVWSIATPIAVAEGIFAERADGLPRAWFSLKALVVFGVLYVAVGLAIRSGSLAATTFRDSPAQLGGAVLVALVTVLVAVRLPWAADRVTTSPSTGAGLRDATVGVVGLSAFQLGHELGPAWLACLIMGLTLGGLGWYAWTRRPSPAALAVGALATYAWVGIANAAGSGLGVGAVVEQVLLVLVVAAGLACGLAERPDADLVAAPAGS